jgi:hypothetical protein
MQRRLFDEQVPHGTLGYQNALSVALMTQGRGVRLKGFFS